MTFFKNKKILITGGTGSLGSELIPYFINEEAFVTVFSRDEGKQFHLKNRYPSVDFRIGDVRDFVSLKRVVDGHDIVINAAALKQVPSCEYFPYEAVQTNITGAENIVRAVEECKYNTPDIVVGVSTDKACKPVNVMGATKSIQEKIFIHANLRCTSTKFVCVRYGNVIASRGSVIPLFIEQIEKGGPVTVTTTAMTRFLLPMNEAVLTVVSAIIGANPGEIWIPIIKSAYMYDVAAALIGNKEIKVELTGIRPGEKIDEIMISEEEKVRVIKRMEYRAGGEQHYYFAICPTIIPSQVRPTGIEREYSSKDNVMNYEQTKEFLREQGYIKNLEAA